MTTSLGWAATPISVDLNPGHPFIDTLELPEGADPLPDGTTVTLHLTAPGWSAIWPAATTPTAARWEVPAAAVDTVPPRAHAELTVAYPDAGSWPVAAGPVVKGRRRGLACPAGGITLPLPGGGRVLATPAPGPPGPQGTPGPPAPRHTHTQATPAATWTITHNLGRHPAAVTVLDHHGHQLVADTAFPDNTTVTVTFAAPAAGRVEIA